MRFVILLGFLSLLSDMTYESARSITGPFLATLGASGFVVGAVAGVGELVGYSVRLVSGRAAVTPRSTWALAMCGYAVNLFAVPALALAGSWPVAAALIVAERIGKGTRVPPRDAMLSHATETMGRGWGFGLHEAMDQTGALLGPLMVAAVIAAHHSDRTAFALLVIPAALAIAVLGTARLQYPNPRSLERAPAVPDDGRRFPQAFWIYMVAAGLIGAGFADFPLIAFHFERSKVVSADTVPLLYALAMGVAGASALVLGRVFDRRGLRSVVIGPLIGAAFAPLVFYGGPTTAVVGMVCWGVGMGAQDSVIRAVVATMIHADRRSYAYGVFNTAFGVCWFAGSALMGVLYDVDRVALVVFSTAIQVSAAPLLLVVALRLRDGAALGAADEPGELGQDPAGVPGRGHLEP
jgi:MFS family permease